MADYMALVTTVTVLMLLTIGVYLVLAATMRDD